MKTIFKTGIIFLISIVLLILSYKVITTVHRKKVISTAIQNIPDFALTTLNGPLFSNYDLKKNTPVIFIYFNTGCDFCQHEAISIRENIQLFNNVQILFLSSEPIVSIRDFAKNYDLTGYSNVIFLNDKDSKVATQFDISVIPTTLTYNKDLKFFKRFKGQMKAENIIKGL